MDEERKKQAQTAKDKTAGTGNVITQDKRKQRILLFVIAGALLLLLAALIIGVASRGDNGEKLQEQLDLGAK